MRYVRPKSATSLHAILCNAQRTHRGGLGAKKSPTWSAERRASPGCADCASWSARGHKGGRSRPAGLRHWPANGCLASTRAPVGAPLPLVERDEYTKLGGQMPRENEPVRLRRRVGKAISASTRVFDALWPDRRALHMSVPFGLTVAHSRVPLVVAEGRCCRAPPGCCLRGNAQDADPAPTLARLRRRPR